MKKFVVSSLITILFVSSISAQYSLNFKISDNDKLLNNKVDNFYFNKNKDDNFQLKTRKTVNMYVGAGYSFVIFTNNVMSGGYPLLDTRSGDFLSEVNIYFGLSIAKAVTLEFEPSILFTRNNSQYMLTLNSGGYYYAGSYYYYDFPYTSSLLAFPITVNGRFFPFFKLTNFFRLFFVGAGAGAVWVHEDYDHELTADPFLNGYNYTYYSSTSSQWSPLFRIMTGFTGSGGAFGFGGEIRYNFVPLKNNGDPFRTRIAKNFNSVDIAARFYFSL